MKVKDVMVTDPICITLPNTRREALRLLVLNNITGMPVTKEDGTLVGVVTRQDLFEHPHETQLAMIMDTDFPTVDPSDSIESAAKILHASWIFRVMVTKNDKLMGLVAPADLIPAIEKRKITDPVDAYISATTVPIYELTPLPTAATIIRLSKAYALPVLNETGQLTGILTDRDIFNLSVIDDSVALTELGLGDDEDQWTWEGLRNIMKLYYEVSKIDLPAIPVKEVMIKDPRTVFAETSVHEAARIMRKYDFGQVPVRDSGDKLIGMVFDVDIIKSLFNQ